MVSEPNRLTIASANTGPIPRINPLDKNRRMPSTEVGATQTIDSALNCLPKRGSSIQVPVAVSSSPTQTVAHFPTTVTRRLSPWRSAIG